MRTRAFKLCLEHWKLALIIALAMGVSGWVNQELYSQIVKAIPFSHALGGLLASVVSGVINILLFPLTVGVSYALLNLWQCTPAHPGQLLVFYKNPSLRRSVFIMGGVYVLITSGLAAAYSFITALLGGSMIGGLITIPLSVLYLCLSVFISMRLFLVPILYLADPNCPAEETVRASYHRMQGHCVGAFGFMFVTMLCLLPILIVISIIVVMGTMAVAIPSMLLGSESLTNLAGMGAATLLITTTMGFLQPFVGLCSIGYAVENVLGHPAPPPANRFEVE